jgi:hypothetical protein
VGVAEELAETPLGSGQQPACTEDGIWLLETRVRDDRDLRRWLLGLGDEVEVLASRALREELARTGARAAARYARLGQTEAGGTGSPSRRPTASAGTTGATTTP